MKIVLEKKVHVLYIEYDNSDTSDRNEVYESLDNRFGSMNYTRKRSGPHPSKKGMGLMIIEVNIED